MNFRREEVVEYYLRDTHVENIFINEYMTSAPGDYVKVYLFALMYAGYKIPMDNYTVSKQLGIEPEDVLKAWSYWEKMGVIKKHFEDSEDRFNYQIEFLNLKEKIYGDRRKKKKVAKVSDGSEQLEQANIKELFSKIERTTGRLFSGKEPLEIISWIDDYGATPEVILMAYNQAMKAKKQSSPKYVGAIVKEWMSKDLRTKEAIENHLSETDNRHYLYKRVMKSLGFTRNATEGEMSIMDSWFDQMSLSIEKVLEACDKTSGISNPNINYVNSVLKAWGNGSDGKSTKGGAQNNGNPNYINLVMQEYEDLRRKSEEDAENRRIEVYKAIPKIQELDQEARLLTLEMSKLMLGGGQGGKSRLNDIKKKITTANTEKAYLMTENNFNLDYMDIVYSCPLCKDTGTQDTGERCSCFAVKLEAVQKKY